MTNTQPIHTLKRRARLLAKESGIPLHAALDQVARDAGYQSWGHLSARTSSRAYAPRMARDLFAQLEPGDFMLLGARPRQGKTLLGLELVVEALNAGRSAVVFSGESTDQEIRGWLDGHGCDWRAVRTRLRVDTADHINADHIIRTHRDAGSGFASRGSAMVVDYLQLLDSRRSDAGMDAQLTALRDYTRDQGLITVCLSQIHRAFEDSRRAVPTRADVRQQNPFDLDVFTKGCFLHRGRVTLDRWS